MENDSADSENREVVTMRSASLNDAKEDLVRMRKTRAKGRGLVELRAARADIQRYLDNGYPQYLIYEKLRERGLVTISYRQFRTLKNREFPPVKPAPGTSKPAASACETSVLAPTDTSNDNLY